jgi:hypothetical protein
MGFPVIFYDYHLTGGLGDSTIKPDERFTQREQKTNSGPLKKEAPQPLQEVPLMRKLDAGPGPPAPTP